MVELRFEPEVAALVDGTIDARADPRSAGADDREVACAQARARRARRPLRRRATHAHAHAEQVDAAASAPVDVDDLRRHDHALADERRNGRIGRLAIELRRRRHLQQAAAVHHRDAVGQRHRLGLIVRDVDHRRPGARVEAGELVLHRRAQMHVEVGERLVEQHQRGLGDEAARERDALALAAREQRGRRSAKPSSSTSVSAAATRRVRSGSRTPATVSP